MAQQAGQDAAVQLVELHELQQIGEARLALIHAEVKAALCLALGYGHRERVVRKRHEFEGLLHGSELRSPLLLKGKQEIPGTWGTRGGGCFLVSDEDNWPLGVLCLHCRNLGLGEGGDYSPAG